jgi:hypothetical protein
MIVQPIDYLLIVCFVLAGLSTAHIAADQCVNRLAAMSRTRGDAKSAFL